MRHILLAVLLWPALAMADPVLPCDLPADLTTPSHPLPAVARALTAHRLDILALGSGSTVGDSGGSNGPAFVAKTPGASFPYKTAEALRQLLPDSQIQLTVGGGRNMTADAMLPLLRQELASHHYDVVLWQTGTVEAVRGTRPDSLYEVLQDGAGTAAEAHADLILIDPQFSRFLRANVDLGPYQAELQQMAGSAGVTLFHRFDLTQQWAGSGQVDLERVTRDQRDETVAALNACLGQALARFILAGSALR